METNNNNNNSTMLGRTNKAIHSMETNSNNSTMLGRTNNTMLGINKATVGTTGDLLPCQLLEVSPLELPAL
jgi:hypothetical protein